MLIVLGLAKLFATSLVLATGWKGGYIFPIMFASVALGLAVNLLFPGIPVAVAVAATMAGALVAALKAPLFAALFTLVLVQKETAAVIAVAVAVSALLTALLALRAARHAAADTNLFSLVRLLQRLSWVNDGKKIIEHTPDINIGVCQNVTWRPRGDSNA